MKYLTIDGNEACSRTSYYFTELSAIYPITPATPMAEYVDKNSLSKKNIFSSHVSVVQMQSEAGAASVMHGALSTGTLSTTYTASQGLLLMIPLMYKMSGEQLPGVIHVAARTVATHALSIMGDHSDIYATVSTGFAYLASSSVLDASILSGIAHLSALEAKVPFCHFFDGFRTSHEINKIYTMEKSEWESIIDYDIIDEFKKTSLNISNPMIQGTTQNDDVYFQNFEARNTNYNKLPNIVEKYMNKVNKITGYDYKPFNYYGDKNATKVIVAMGSVCNTIREVVEDIEGVGLVEVHLFRPFSTKHLNDVLPKSTTKIAVLDKARQQGSNGILYLDVLSNVEKDIEVIGGVYGLSGKDTNYKHIKSVYDYLDKEDKVNNFSVGIIDDITNLSIDIDEKYRMNSNLVQMKIYGYGSDGLVGSSKNIVKLIGDNTKLYPQGYFQYDSKKSGGLTISHIRLGSEEIRSSYYITSVHIVVISKESYLDKYDVLDSIEENGVVIINSHFTSNDISSKMSIAFKKIVHEKNLKVYIIPANEIALKNNLGLRIGTIMEAAIYTVTKIYEPVKAIKLMKDYVYKRFKNKSEDIVNNNYKAIDSATKFVKELKIEYTPTNINDRKKSDYELVVSNKGNELKVSSFIDNANGRFEGGNTCIEKRKISQLVPSYKKDNCIQCNQCSFVCPHAVIRPFILNKEQVINGNLESDVKKLIPSKEEDYYMIGVSIDDCTGCGLCVKTCPGLKGNKALEMVDYEVEDNKKTGMKFDYLYSLDNKLNLVKNGKNSQFLKPSFEFSGACSGCGETPYINLISRLYGKNLMIANATGCSSIYGASYPHMPYHVSWANSLFEDATEFGYGMYLSYENQRHNLITYVNQVINDIDTKNKIILENWLKNLEDLEICKEVYKSLDFSKLDIKIKNLKEYFEVRIFYIIGGDGFAYDIGYGGLDHVLSTKANVNILILDTESYSNTGGQVSKATPIGSVAQFAALGKVYQKKDLAKMALAYPHCYVGVVNIGYSKEQYYKTITEATSYNGPSIILAYAPCISHGIKGGLENSLSYANMATKCGYYPIFRYNPQNNKFSMDSKVIDIDLYDEFLMSQDRYTSLLKSNKDRAKELLEANKLYAIKRYNYYLRQEKSQKEEEEK